jgi:hypothetical protein
MSGWTQEFESAMAWFAAAPAKVKGSVDEALAAAQAELETCTQAVKDTVAGAAQWSWAVIQGDFAEEQSTAQVVTGTVISMIPGVDQICDVRDIVANCKKIHTCKEDEDSTWHWVALVLTLIGLFPVLGSLFKGCFKVLFRYVRKALAKSGGAKAGAAVWKVVAPLLEEGIGKLNEFLARPAVRKYLSSHRIDNIYKAIADKIREVAARLNTEELFRVLDEQIVHLKDALAFIRKWGGGALGEKAGRLLEMVNDVRKRANTQIGDVLRPVQDILDRTAQRLDVEHALQYRAATNAFSPHQFKRINLDAELAKYEKNRPGYVDELAKHPHPRADIEQYQAALKDADAAIEQAIKDGRLRARTDIPDLARGDHYKNFTKDMRFDVIPEGEVLYRVLDPGSSDNAFYWMTKAEFDKLQSKDDWRRRFAVWVGWNKDGEVVAYTVPPGGLPVWRGTAATQDGGKFMLAGGGEQIFVNPAHLDQRFADARKATGWGYNDLGEQADLTGVPTLQRNWYDNDDLRQARVMDLHGE